MGGAGAEYSRLPVSTPLCPAHGAHGEAHQGEEAVPVGAAGGAKVGGEGKAVVVLAVGWAGLGQNGLPPETAGTQTQSMSAAKHNTRCQLGGVHRCRSQQSTRTNECQRAQHTAASRHESITRRPGARPVHADTS